MTDNAAAATLFTIAALTLTAELALITLGIRKLWQHIRGPA